MKKKLAVICLVFVMLFTLAACSGGSGKDPIVGTWKPDKVLMYGDEYSLKDLKSLLGDYAEEMFDISLKFTDDGKVTGTAYGESSEGTWKSNGDGTYDVTLEGGTETLTLDGNSLIMGDENEGFVFFPNITPVQTKTEANKPYLLRVLNTPSDETLSFIVRQKGGTVKATSTMDSNYLFAGETATGSSSVATGSSVTYTFNAFGGYSGKLLAHNSTTYFYFAKNKFVSSDQLLDSYTTIKVQPFRSYYLTTKSGGNVKGLNELGIIFDEGIGNMDATGIKDVQTTKPDLMIEVGKGYMTLTSTADQDVKVYSVSGVNVLNAKMQNGESKTVAVPSGIYIVNGAKLIVK